VEYFRGWAPASALTPLLRVFTTGAWLVPLGVVRRDHRWSAPAIEAALVYIQGRNHPGLSLACRDLGLHVLLCGVPQASNA
jgi:hypothetical protein